MSPATEQRFLTSGEAARALDLPEWRVRQLMARPGLPFVVRLGTMRGVAPADLGRLREALEARGQKAG
jgi:hypothetical protein